MKKILTIFMCMAMFMCFMPSTAFADEVDTNVAKIGDIGYDTLEAAINNVNANETITLIKNVTLTAPLSIGKTVTIDGQGQYSILAGDTFSGTKIISIESGTAEQMITLKNMTLDAMSKGRGIVISKGTLSLDNTIVTKGLKSDSWIGGIYVTGNAIFVMNSGEIKGNSVSETYKADGYLQYSADLWIGANAKGEIKGGTIGNAFINANSYSASNKGNFKVSSGNIDNMLVETDAGFTADASVTVDTPGTIKKLLVRSEVGLNSVLDASKINRAAVSEIALADNISLTNAVTISGGPVTFDLNGKTLSNGQDNDTIVNNGTLTIKDAATGGKIINNAAHKSVIQNNSGGIVYLQGGSIEKPQGSGSHYVITNHGTMTMNGGTVTSVHANASAVENGWADPTLNTGAQNSVMTINGGTVANGGLYTVKNDDYGVMTINDGTFTNTTTNAGNVLNWNELTINGGKFEAQNVSVATACVGDTTPTHPDFEQGKTTIKGGQFNQSFGEVIDGSGNFYNNTAITVAIMGGTFPSIPKAKYIAPGYEAKLVDSKYEVSRIYVPSAPSAPVVTPDPVVNDKTAETTTAKIEPTTVGGKTTATVDTKTANTIVDKAIENKSSEVVINASSSTPVTPSTTPVESKVELPTAAVKDIVEKTDANIVVKTDAATIELDQTAAQAVADKAGEAEKVNLVVETKAEKEDQVVIELKIETASGNVTDFKGGNVKVTVNIPKALEGKKVVCVYVDENGNYTKMEGKLNNDGTYTFVTGHFSTYVVMTEEEAAAAIEAQKSSKIAAGVQATTLKVRSSAAKGKITVKWTKSKGFKVDYYQVFKATKKNGTFKYLAKTTKLQLVNKKGLKAGKTYYFKVRGVRVVDGAKIYTNWSKLAIRKAK